MNEQPCIKYYTVISKLVLGAPADHRREILSRSPQTPLPAVALPAVALPAVALPSEALPALALPAFRAGVTNSPTTVRVGRQGREGWQAV